MKLFFQNISKPYPLNDSIKSRISNCVLFGLFVFLFLFVFKPFELGTIKNKLLFVSLGYGAVCCGVMFFLNVIVFRFFPRFFSENIWTVKKELFWSIINILAIGIANFLYSYALQISNGSFLSLLWFFVYTIALGIFPMAAIVLLNFKRLSNKFEGETQQIKSNVEHLVKSNPEFDDLEIEISSESGNLEIKLKCNEFLFAKSADNYVEIFFASEKGVNRKLIRNTLKCIYAFFPSNKEFFRCHKSYIINLKHVNHITGNAQGFKLHLKQTQEPIPVSRANNLYIKNYFANRP